MPPLAIPAPIAAPRTPASGASPLAPLVDRFGRRHTYLRVSVTERCNLRCVYCMPAGGVALRPREEILTFEEIERLARLFARMGVDKVRLTGGEPLARRGLEELVAALATVPGVRQVAMTTNGVLLGPVAERLRAAGLTHLNVSLDTLRHERFLRIARRDEFARTIEGIEAALAAGFRPLKLNCVVIGGFNDDEPAEFVARFADRPVNVRFIEFMPFRDNDWQQGNLVPWRATRAAIERDWRLEPVDDQHPSDVARDFRIVGHEGTVSFITSMTEDFCAGCNRVRLLADGSIKSCLFQPPERNLRELLRAGADDGALERAIREAIGLKPEKHAPPDELAAGENNAMIEIGG